MSLNYYCQFIDLNSKLFTFSAINQQDKTYILRMPQHMQQLMIAMYRSSPKFINPVTVPTPAPIAAPIGPDKVPKATELAVIKIYNGTILKLNGPRSPALFAIFSQ